MIFLAESYQVTDNAHLKKGDEPTKKTQPVSFFRLTFHIFFLIKFVKNKFLPNKKFESLKKVLLVMHLLAATGFTVALIVLIAQAESL